ncbi:thioesterase family protein [Gordonia sp. NPDC127522]|uniref:thioesterase family protein n=1 Tax=Gordonia sp. NPDC127522 TaxID=3345390 RepID=UPI00362AB55D
MARRSFPNADDVVQVKVWHSGVVPPEHVDANDHLNIVGYLQIAADGFARSGADVGIDADYLRERRLSTFVAEHHITYLAELQAGERFSVHIRFLSRSDKVYHAMAFVLAADRNVLAATCEATVVHVSLKSRRPQEFPADVAAAIDLEVDRSENLPWPAPVCGAMGIRR